MIHDQNAKSNTVYSTILPRLKQTSNVIHLAM